MENQKIENVDDYLLFIDFKKFEKDEIKKLIKKYSFESLLLKQELIKSSSDSSNSDSESGSDSNSDSSSDSESSLPKKLTSIDSLCYTIKKNKITANTYQFDSCSFLFPTINLPKIKKTVEFKVKNGNGIFGVTTKKHNDIRINNPDYDENSFETQIGIFSTFSGKVFKTFIEQEGFF
jgi:hypothetical protein